MSKRKVPGEIQNRPSKQNSLILWLFFLTFLLNTIVFLITFEINRGLMFFILSESHYKGYYLNSVTALRQYTDTQSEKDYEVFRQNMNRLFSFKKAFDEANRPSTNFKTIQYIFDDLGFGKENSIHATLVFKYLGNTSLFVRNKAMMVEILNLNAPLQSIGEEIRYDIRSRTFNDLNRKQKMVIIGKIDNQIISALTMFSDQISILSDKVSLVTEASSVGFGLVIVLGGVYGTWRIVKRSESYRKSLERSEANLRLSMEQLPVRIWNTDKDLILISMKGGAPSMLNLEYSEIIGKSVREIFKNTDFEDIVVLKHERALLGEAGSYELKVLDQYWYGHVEPFRNETGDILGVVWISYEITEKRKYEESILNEKERLLVKLRSIGDAVITTNSQGNVVLINPVAEKLTGWRQNEAEGNPLSLIFKIFNEITGQPIEDPVRKVIITGQVVALANHTYLKSKEGNKIPIADSGAPIRDKEGNIIGVVLVFRDMTHEYKMQNEILRQMKLESLGLLAGGIAHDFNNILTAILGNVSLARIELDSKVTVNRYLDETEKATLKAKELASQLLTFSKGGIPQKKILSIKPLIEESTRFALRGSNIVPLFHFPDTLWRVMVDPGQITQVVHNLIINAQHAMPKGGEIVITAQNETLDEQGAKTLVVTEGSFVSICFKDNGAGIPKEIKNKIFDPFFTTKEKGSGLGLFSVFSILKNHDGAVTFESRVGLGTTFCIYLPAVLENLHEEEIKENIVFYGTGRILMMDDDELIRNMAVAMLGKLGYEVEVVRTGEEALDMYRKGKETNKPFRAVIMELTIPGGKGGKATIKELLTIDPDAVAIVSSGYSNDPVMANYLEHGFKGRVVKPYRIEDLSETLSKIINN